jgi:hypothetical protein
VGLELSLGAHGDGYVTMRVRGRVVDARTGAPIAGAVLLTLPDPEVVDDPARLEQRWRFAGPFQEADDRRATYSMIESTRTGADGSFKLLVGLPFWTREGGFTGITWVRSRSDPYDVVRALLVEADGYARLVHRTKHATWREQDVEETGGEIVGTLDVGTIRLELR